MASAAPVPVTLLTGFLGAGKTTLLNRLLSDPASGRVAVVVNEFGELGVDGSLVVGSDEDVVELRNGCVCCNVRGDLARSVGKLLERRRGLFRRLRFDRLVIELSGLASPGPVVQTLVVDDRLREETRLRGIVALASAPELDRQLADYPEASVQLGYADLVLLNHTDRASSAEVAASAERVRQLNGTAELERCVRAEVPVERLLELDGTDPGRWGLGEQEPHGCGTDCDDPEHDHGHDHGHAHGEPHAVEHGEVETVSFRSDRPLDLHRLKVWLQFVASRRDAELIRIKGILRCRGQASAVVVQAVYQWLEIGPGELEPPDESRLVLIGRGLEREQLENGWRTLAE